MVRFQSRIFHRPDRHGYAGLSDAAGPTETTERRQKPIGSAHSEFSQQSRILDWSGFNLIHKNGIILRTR